MDVRGILLIIFILILLYIIIKVIYSQTKPLSSIQDGTTMTTIDYSNLAGGSNGANTGNFTYSVWFYVNDWNYRYGEPKVVFGRMSSASTANTSSIPGVSGIDPCPSVVLGAMQNNLSISLACYPGTDTMHSPLHSSGSTIHSPAPSSVGSTSYNAHGVTSGKGVASTASVAPTAVTNPPTSSAAPSSSIASLASSPMATSIFKNYSNTLLSNVPRIERFETMTSNSVVHTCNIANVPIQKWVNLLISVYGRTLDVYIDGKLVKTCLLPGIAKINNKAPVYLTPSGGFSGWTSNLQYWPNSTDPQTAWNIYNAGYGSTNTFGQYKVKVSVYKGVSEQSSLTI